MFEVLGPAYRKRRDYLGLSRADVLRYIRDNYGLRISTGRLEHFEAGGTPNLLFMACFYGALAEWSRERRDDWIASNLSIDSLFEASEEDKR